jgi:hypothetical protein
MVFSNQYSAISADDTVSIGNQFITVVNYRLYIS